MTLYTKPSIKDLYYSENSNTSTYLSSHRQLADELLVSLRDGFHTIVTMQFIMSLKEM